MGILINILSEGRLLINIHEITEFRGGFPNNILTKRLLAHPSLCMLEWWKRHNGTGFVSNFV